MNTRLLMRVSAIFLAGLGLATSFLPAELLTSVGDSPTVLASTLLQISGALYLGFGTLNWMAQGNLIGGIYSRPVALANFGHFTVGAIVLVKALLRGQISVAVGSLCAAYVVFSLIFALVVFRHPAIQQQSRR